MSVHRGGRGPGHLARIIARFASAFVGAFLLEDGVSYLLLEDGSKLLGEG